MPGLEVRPLLDELRARVAEELDYRLEASLAGRRSPRPSPVTRTSLCRRRVLATDHVLVSEWMDGTPLSKIISDGTQEQRDRAGLLLVRMLFSSPARAGLLHADPHPGNFRLLDDGRLGVLDFGAVDRLPDGLPPLFGQAALAGASPTATSRRSKRTCASTGSCGLACSVDLDALQGFLAPLADPSRVESFNFSREWMRARGRQDDRPARRQRRPGSSTCRRPTS